VIPCKNLPGGVFIGVFIGVLLCRNLPGGVLQCRSVTVCSFMDLSYRSASGRSVDSPISIPSDDVDTPPASKKK
jgi:hypothetical protein